MKSKTYHESVMVSEVVKTLHINKFSKFIDATLGTGGHSLEILKRGGSVLGIEADGKMLEIAKVRIGSECPTSNYKLVQGNFTNIKHLASDNGFEGVDGILFDLGVSNLHLKNDLRGFSFDKPDQELDMRLDPSSQGVKASDLLNALDVKKLTSVFAVTMKYPDAISLSKKIVEKRPLMKVSDLLNLIGDKRTKSKLHPATLPFLALRIAVNSELENLTEVLPKAFNLLKPEGKLLIITFHSAEQKIIEKFNKNADLVLPSEEEVEKNPRSRSAKLWIIKK